MPDNDLSKEDLDNIPYEIQTPLDGKYLIDQHSIFYNILIYFYVLFFYGFSICPIYFYTHTPRLNKTYFLTGTYNNFTSHNCLFNFTEMPLENAHLQIGIKLYPNIISHNDLDALFNISTFPEKRIYSMKKFSNLSNEEENGKSNISIKETNYEQIIYDQDTLNIKFISVQGYFTKEIRNFSKAKITIQINHNYLYDFMRYSILYIALTTFLFMFIKIFHLQKLDELSLNQFIPLVFLSFCASSSFPILKYDHNHSFIFHKITDAYLSTVFFEISFSFIFFTIFNLPINFFESFLDFFLSVLILLYCFLFQILKMRTAKVNPTILLALLYVTYIIRNLQKGYYWFIIRNKQAFVRSIVYTFINIMTTSILIFCHYLITTNINNQIFILAAYISLISYGIAMTLYNSP